MDLLKGVRPTWAEINLDNLINNIKEVKRVTSDNAKITAVVKADAYGHGADVVTRYFLENGATRLAVAALTEAVHLRKFYDVPILVLGYTPDYQADIVVENNIIQTIYTYQQAKMLSEEAKKQGKTVLVHLKLETGMSRLGFMPNEESLLEIIKISKLDNINIEGMFTHFALADSKCKTTTNQQYQRYMDFAQMLKDNGIDLDVKHVSNSAAIIDLPEYNLDMVRAGIMLYGLEPSDEVKLEKVNLKPAMSLKSKIAHIKELEAGCGISYGHIYTTKQKQIIGTIPIGYADGYTRMLSEKAYVSVNGQKAPVIGRICMDQCMIDLTNVQNVNVGDEVVLFGDDGISPSIDDIAQMLGTINYEVICMIGKRVPRVYKKNGEVVEVLNYI